MAKKTKAPLAQGSPIIIAIGFFIFGSMVGFSFSRIADNSLSHCPTISNDILNDKRDHTVDNSAELTSLLKETISYMKEWKVEKSLSSHSTSSSSSSSSSSSHEVQKLQTEKQTLLKKLAEAEATTDVVAHAASPVMGSSSTLNIVSNVLTFAAPVVIRDAAKVDDNGFLTAPQSSELSHFSLDVGFNKGRVTVNDWLEKQPHLYVISVEAIPALYTLFETMMSSETQIGDGGAGAGEGDTAVPYWKLTKFHASQRALKYKKYCMEENRCMMINGAVSSTPGVAEFNTGVGRDANGRGATDTASLFQFKDKGAKERASKWSSTLVRKFRLDDLLSHVPKPTDDFMWDTLKVDIQGGDVDALVSCGDYLKHFTCVIGEFDIGSYEIPSGVETNPAPVLQKAGFVDTKIHGRMVWINRRFKEQYLANPESFGCHRVHDVPVNLNRLKAAFQKV